MSKYIYNSICDDVNLLIEDAFSDTNIATLIYLNNFILIYYQNIKKNRFEPYIVIRKHKMMNV